MVEVKHKGKKPNKDAVSGNVPRSVLWCVRASEFAPTPSTEAGLSFFHSYICQSLAKGWQPRELWLTACEGKVVPVAPGNASTEGLRCLKLESKAHGIQKRGAWK